MKNLIPAALGVVVIACAGCGSDTPTVAPESGTVDVTYLVTGTAKSAAITQRTPTGTSQASTGIPLVSKAGSSGLRWTFQRGSAVYISAQNKSAAGTITCRIEVGGKVVSENTANGAHAIATCSATA